MSSYLNRNSIGMHLSIKWLFIIDDTFAGHAKLMGIETDLHMSRSESDWAISIFFVAYVRKYISEFWDILMYFLLQLIFGIPSNLLLRFVGPTRYLSLSTIAWGSITIGMAFVRNTRELLIVRFLLVRWLNFD
jgi:hypothetical protein